MAISFVNIFILTATSLILSPNIHGLVTEHWWGTTTFNVEELKYTWTINNFDALRLAKTNGLSSPEFWAADDDKHKWRLSLEDIDVNNVNGVYLQPSFNDSLNVKFSISINGIESSAIHNFTDGEHYGFPVPIGTGFQVINMNSSTITFDCKIKKVDSVMNSTRRCEAPKENSPSNELIKDFEVLFHNGSFSDVTFYIDRETIRAHKAVLGARSTVFLEKLEHDGAYYRYRDIVVEVKGTEFKVFKELLRYIYVGQVEHLDEMAEKLLIAAEKYKVEGLKKLCEEQLCKNLNTHNAFATLSFANEQGLHELSSVTAKFIASHGTGILSTDEFKDVESKLNNSLLDIFHAYYDK